MRFLLSCSTIAAVALACCSGSHAQVLYDGSLATAPAAQGWYYVTKPLIDPLATQFVGGGATTLKTTKEPDERAGYFSDVPFLPAHPDVGVLDSSVGFAVRFTAQVVTEDHSLSADRAGFNVIVIDSAAMGVELGFWADEVWAQTDVPLFTHSATEQAAFDTTAAMTQYQLAFQPNTYSLSAGGGLLFAGPLKDYSDFDHDAAGLPMDPYETQNFMFFGDDTGSASTEVAIARIELIPEPATAAVLLVGFAAALARRKRPAA